MQIRNIYWSTIIVKSIYLWLAIPYNLL
ncbi:unnamed protein product [Blumeria hordei]|uniref:Uncharacterized protein n=1 Tax=Blumeria hordei TaxID=2867405 RepID=A0A383UL03_BLUHO|nr:unnamed protein product [Blumeria hordei]